MSQKAYRIMGVMNVTPDSFSDGNSSFNLENALAKFEKLAKVCDVIDIGAESTAPKNAAISEDLEWQRLETLVLPVLKSYQGKHQHLPQLSLDTYKFSTIQKFWEELQKLGIRKLWWNDVSGLIEPDVLSFLKKEKGLSYIYCHNRVPQRALSGQHMKYVDVGIKDIKQELIERFSHVQELFKNAGMEERLHFDPCFGFAKTREQNHDLIKVLPELLQAFPHNHWVLGISRKSFLAFLEEEGDFVYREMLHFMLISQWIKKFSHLRVTYRVHDPNIITLADKTKHFS